MDLNGGKGWDAALNKKLIYMVMGILILILLRTKTAAATTAGTIQTTTIITKISTIQFTHQPLLGNSRSRDNSLSSPRNNNKLGYQSIQQQQQDSRNAKFFNSNNAQQQQQQQAYLQQNGMIPIRDNDVELHSDMSSYTRKRSGTWLSWIFCCCS